jgi:hypothetical protein
VNVIFGDEKLTFDFKNAIITKAYTTIENSVRDTKLILDTVSSENNILVFGKKKYTVLERNVEFIYRPYKPRPKLIEGIADEVCIQNWNRISILSFSQSEHPPLIEGFNEKYVDNIGILKRTGFKSFSKIDGSHYFASMETDIELSGNWKTSAKPPYSKMTHVVVMINEKTLYSLPEWIKTMWAKDMEGNKTFFELRHEPLDVISLEDVKLYAKSKSDMACDGQLSYPVSFFWEDAMILTYPIF